MNANFAAKVEVKSHVEMIKNVTDTWKMTFDIFCSHTTLHIGHIPMIAGNRVAHRICTDLTYSRTYKDVGESVSVNAMYIIMVLSKEPI